MNANALLCVALLAGLLGGCASSPGVRIEAGTLLLAELRHPLTRALVDAGEIAPGERREQLATTLQRAGFTSAQIDAGQVWIVRDYIYWHNTASGIKRSHLGFMLAAGPATPQPGQVVEMQVRDDVPAVLERVRAPSLAEGGCFYAEIENSLVKDLMGAVSMVGASGVASLYCSGIEREGWQRPRTLWHKPAGAVNVASAPAPGGRAIAAETEGATPERPPEPGATDLAALLITRNRAMARGPFSLPVWIDGQKVTVLDNGQCDIVLLPAGEYRVVVGTGELLGLPRRELTVRVGTGERWLLAYVTDQSKWDSWGMAGLLTSRQVIEDSVFSFSQRVAGTGDTCALRGPARQLKPPPTP